MAILTHFLGALFAISTLLSFGQAQNTSVSTQWPLHNDGLNDVVQWDHYSFMLDGKRFFSFGGEFHYWRIPVPALWKDVMQKMKASGATTVAIYSHWGLHHPLPNVTDFETTFRDIGQLYATAKEVGLLMLVRPGPYINAEANAGGYPLWATTGAYGSLRNNDTRYEAAWTPYMSRHAEITSKYTVVKNNSVALYQIENELSGQWINVAARTPNNTLIQYMEELEATARSNGIDVPLTHNAPNMNGRSWSMDYGAGFGGNVDVYGLDSYPACWTCDPAPCGGAVTPFTVQNYYDHFQLVSPTQPEFMPEFQGGSLNPWGGPQGGCPANTSWDFANLFYRHNVGQRVTALSLYMYYGGTNWGGLGAPVVATSYDYSAPISEYRSIGDKYAETKLLAFFLRSAADLTKTDRIGNSTTYTTNAAILATELRNPDTKAAFYVTIHAQSTSATVENFQLHVSTSAGNLTVPQKGGSITLNGHQSKILVTDFTFGDKTLIYSTAEVLTYSLYGGDTTVVLWVPTGESGEFYLKGGKVGNVQKCQGCSNVGFYPAAEGLIATFTQTQGMTVLTVDDVRVVILDRTYAYQFWTPSLSTDPLASHDDTILVQGPYLVRTVSTGHSYGLPTSLALEGDIANSTTLEVFVPKGTDALTWNGKALQVEKTPYGTLKASLPGSDTSLIKLPTLTSWKSQDSLPERLPTYSASGPAWVTADHTTALNPNKINATVPYLYIDEYGFHMGTHLWRGSFTGAATGVSLNVQGGNAFGWSAYLNGGFIGSYLGSAADESGNLTLSFSNATVYTNGSENHLLVIQDNTGHDETTGALNPRGVINYNLLSANGSNATFSEWRVAGTAGGSQGILIDPVRGPQNEGGLTAERLGWHLPGFDDSVWPSSTSNSTTTSTSNSTSLSFTGSGIRFFRTTIPLSIPSGYDVSLSFILSCSGPAAVRVQLFVNGYQYGRFNPWIGNQIDFPVPAGVLNYRGDNVIGLSVWAQTEEGASVGIEWDLKYAYESSFSVADYDDPRVRPGWTADRLAYT